MEYIILTQDIPVGTVSNSQLDDKDKEFLLNQKLIYEKRSVYFSNFVGEVITPHNKYFSLPKNQADDSLIQPIKKLLTKYNNNYKHKSLVSNKSFILTKNNEFKSNRYYFDRLSSFFLDFVTYEFIYPLETKKVHSIEPLPGTIDLVSTKINRGIYGDGATYNIINRENDDDWKLDDIYYSTVIKLAKETGSESEIREIENMRDYLNEEGYNVNEIDISDIVSIIKEIKKCDVNIIHYPIKNTLIEYFEDQSYLKSSNYSINIFYTKNFEIVWENILREILFHKPEDFGEDFINRFNKVITKGDFVPLSKERKWRRETGITEYERDEDRPDYINYKAYDAKPDIFSSSKTEYSKGLINNTFNFIGDAKYYNDTRHDFHKEFSTYNDIQENKYPMVVLVASNKTFIDDGNFRFSRETNKELIILDISIMDVINDYVNNTRNLINDVHRLILKRTRRIRNQK